MNFFICSVRLQHKKIERSEEGLSTSSTLGFLHRISDKVVFKLVRLGSLFLVSSRELSVISKL